VCATTMATGDYVQGGLVVVVGAVVVVVVVVGDTVTQLHSESNKQDTNLLAITFSYVNRFS